MKPEEGMWKQIEVYRRMTGRQRLQIAFELYEFVREMIRCSVRREYPDWDARQVNQEVTRRFRLAERIHPASH